jgi:hypothetical protein
MEYSYIDFISCKNSLFLPKGDINKVNTVFFKKNAVFWEIVSPLSKKALQGQNL